MVGWLRRTLDVWSQSHQKRFRRAAEETNRLPRGIGYIITNEAAERFSYYGMRTILVVFMCEKLRNSKGEYDTMGDAEARSWYHSFTVGVYLFPFLGALLSDGFLGKYITIMSFSLVCCAGHLILSLIETRVGLGVGLVLIAIGAGGIKPCVSANVGDQFCESNRVLLPKVYGYFYLAINIGAFASSIVTPVLLEAFGSHMAFGLPGVVMGIATLVLWRGRFTFVQVPPAGLRAITQGMTREVGLKLGRLLTVHAFLAVFWSLYDQSGSVWVQQAERMNRNLFGVEWLPSQIQAINPLLILLYVPLFNGIHIAPCGLRRCRECRFAGIYGWASQWLELTALRKISMGFFVTILAFGMDMAVEGWISAGETPSILWLLLCYAVLTIAEVLVSVTALEFSYSQAPEEMKSWVMAMYLGSISVGNAVTAAVNAAIVRADGSSRLSNIQYMQLFTTFMLISAVLFLVFMRYYNDDLPTASIASVSDDVDEPTVTSRREAPDRVRTLESFDNDGKKSLSAANY